MHSKDIKPFSSKNPIDSLSTESLPKQPQSFFASALSKGTSFLRKPTVSTNDQGEYEDKVKSSENSGMSMFKSKLEFHALKFSALDSLGLLKVEDLDVSLGSLYDPHTLSGFANDDLNPNISADERLAEENFSTSSSLGISSVGHGPESICLDLDDLFPDSHSTIRMPFEVIPLRSEKEVLRTLDAQFFEPAFDPVLHIVLDMPAMPHDGGSMLMDQYLETELRDMDLAREAITRQLAAKIQENYASLAEGMKQVQAVDKDLSIAVYQASKARQHLKNSSLQGCKPILHVLNLNNRKKLLQNLLSIISSITSVHASEATIISDFESGNFKQMIEKIEELKETFRNPNLTGLGDLKALTAFQERIQCILIGVSEKVIQIVSEICQIFSPEKFEYVAEVCIMLEVLHPITGRFNSCANVNGDVGEGKFIARELQSNQLNNIQLLSDVGRDSVTETDSTLSETYNECKNLFNINPCVTPDFLSLSRPEQAVSNLSLIVESTIIRDIKNSFFCILADEVRDVKLDSLDKSDWLLGHNEDFLLDCFSIPSSSLLRIIVSFCKKCTEVMHSHYEMRKYLCVCRDRFSASPKNNFDCTENSSESSGNNLDDMQKSSVRHEATNAVKKAMDASNQYFGASTTIDSYSAIIDSTEKVLDSCTSTYDSNSSNFSRKDLVLFISNMENQCKLFWNFIARSISKVLSMTAFQGGGLKTDDFGLIIHTIEIMIFIGDEYTSGSEMNTSTKLKELLRAKTFEFFDGAHTEAMVVLGKMIKCEQWHRVPLRQESETTKNDSDGTIIQQIIETSMKNFTSRSTEFNFISCNHRYIVQNRNEKFFERWCTRGNPFEVSHENCDLNSCTKSEHQLTFPESESFKPSDNDKHAGSRLSTSQAKENQFQEMQQDILETHEQKEIGYGMYQNIEVSNEMKSLTTATDEEILLYGSNWVVTQSALNGIVSYMGSYIQIMNLHNHIEPMYVLDGLFALVELYFHSVFTLFIPQERISGLFEAGEEQYMPLLVEDEEYAVLKTYMLRVHSSLIQNQNSNVESKRGLISPKKATNEMSPKGTDSNSANGSSQSSPLSMTPPIRNMILDAQKEASTLETFFSHLPFSTTPTLSKGNVPKKDFFCGSDKVPVPLMLVPDCILNSGGGFNFAPERIIAAESCIFVAKVVELVVEYLIGHRLLSPNNCIRTAAHVTSVLQCALQMRKFIIHCSGSLLINEKQLISDVSAKSWDLDELSNDPSDYVESWTNHLNKLYGIWVSDSAKSLLCIPTHTRSSVYQACVQALMIGLLEGFSRSKSSCSTEGRALMSMDLRALSGGLDFIPPEGPIRSRTYVMGWINAFYFDENDLICWIKANWKQFRYNHIIALLTSSLSCGDVSKIEEIQALYAPYRNLTLPQFGPVIQSSVCSTEVNAPSPSPLHLGSASWAERGNEAGQAAAKAASGAFNTLMGRDWTPLSVPDHRAARENNTRSSSFESSMVSSVAASIGNPLKKLGHFPATFSISRPNDPSLPP